MRWTSKWIAVAPLALLLVSTNLQGQDIKYGIHAGLNLPFGDLGSTLDRSLGYTFGAHANIYYGNGHELRPRVDYQTYRGGWHPEDGVFRKHDVDAWSIGADYVYYLEQRERGIYLTMGLNYNWWDVSPGSSKSSLGLGAGAGYRLNKYWAFEGRFTTSQFRSDSGQANAFQAAAFFNF